MQAQNTSPPPLEPLYQPHKRHPLTLPEVYAEELQVLNPRLTDGEASTLAKAYIEEAKKAELDARLVIAVMYSEGQFTRVRSKGKSVLIGTDDARKAVAAAAKEIAAGIKDAVSHGEKGTAAVRQAMVSRAASQHLKAGAAKSYPDKVMHVYKKLCGG